MIVDSIYPPFLLRPAFVPNDATLHARLLQREACAQIQKQPPERRLETLGAVADLGLAWVATEFSAATCVQIALTWPDGLDAYLEEHRELFERHDQEYPEGVDPEYQVTGALRSLVLAVLEFMQGMDPKPVHTALVLRATATALRGCALNASQGAERNLDAALQTLAGAGLDAPANDNGPPAVHERLRVTP